MSWPVWLFPHNGRISYCHYKGWNDLVGPLSFNFADISMLKGRGCGSVVLLDSNNTIKLTSPLSLFMLCMFCCFAPKWTWDGFSQPLCCSFTVVYTKFHGSFSNPSLCLILTRKALFLFWGPLNYRGGGGHTDLNSVRIPSDLSRFFFQTLHLKGWLYFIKEKALFGASEWKKWLKW